MPIQKIKSGRIITTLVNDYVGDKGTIFYDENTPELRLSDGVTPGGILISAGTGTSIVTTGTASSLTVSLINSSNTITNIFTNTTTLRFDANSGFTLTNLNDGVIKVSAAFVASNIDGGDPDSTYA